jgi:phosphoribosylformylglycinamidine (FGAM) synthase-like enzyme
MEEMLFSEDQGRAVVTCEVSTSEMVVALAHEHQVPARTIGSTGGDRLQIGDGLSLTLRELREAWEPEA